jgi:hypothetical protein
MTFIELLVMLIFVMFGTLLDIAIRVYLGVDMHRSSFPFMYLIGIFIGIAIPLYMDAKNVRKYIFVILMSIPLCITILFIFFLRNWIFTVFTADFTLGFYVPLFGFYALCLIRIITTTFPACKNGKCGKNDFQRCVLPPQEQQEERSNHWITYECRCGDKYVWQEKKLMALDSERKAIPYKKLVGFHKWADDTD